MPAWLGHTLSIKFIKWVLCCVKTIGTFVSGRVLFYHGRIYIPVKPVLFQCTSNTSFVWQSSKTKVRKSITTSDSLLPNKGMLGLMLSNSYYSKKITEKYIRLTVPLISKQAFLRTYTNASKERNESDLCTDWVHLRWKCLTSNRIPRDLRICSLWQLRPIDHWSALNQHECQLFPKWPFFANL